MSFNKLESFSNKDVIREEVSILTDLLTDVTRKILSPETFEKIEMMQDLAVHSKKWSIFLVIFLFCHS